MKENNMHYSKEKIDGIADAAEKDGSYGFALFIITIFAFLSVLL